MVPSVRSEISTITLLLLVQNRNKMINESYINIGYSLHFMLTHHGTFSASFASHAAFSIGRIQDTRGTQAWNG
jgi:hypothetical protein